MSETFSTHPVRFLTNGGINVGGLVYFGVVNGDPVNVIGDRINIFADRALTIALPNPISTGIDGRTAVNGLPAKVWLSDRYSVFELDKFNVEQFQDLDKGESPGGSAPIRLTNIQGTNEITAEASPIITGLVDQQIYTFETIAANSLPVTLDIDGTGAKPIRFNFNEEIKPGFFQSTQTITVIYNATGAPTEDYFNWVDSGRGISILTNVAGTVNAITADGGPSITGYVDGQHYQFKPSGNNTGNVTLQIGTLAVTSIKNKGAELAPGQIVLNKTVEVIYNSTGSEFELVSGAGNVVGPASVTDGRVVVFDQVTGKLLKQGTRLAADLVAGPSSVTANRVAIFNGTTGKLLKQSTLLESQIGKVLQVVEVNSGTLATTTASIPDTTIPQSSEGAEFMTLSITPKVSTSTLFIDVTVQGSTSGSVGYISALFKDSIANALAGSINAFSAGGAQNVQSFSHKIAASTISLQTFKVRCGIRVGSGTFRINGTESGAQALGSISQSSIKITEVGA